MSGYRRFVAYVYEYEGRKKGNGKGFVKVEVRDGVCRMQFRLSGVYGQETLPCEIYGYVREEEKQECEAVYLGTCDLAGEIIAFSLELTGENVSESGYSIDDFNGIVFLAGDVMYGTGWDENPVCLDEIRFGKKKEENGEEIEELKEEGIDISVVDMYTIKPLDTEMIEAVAKECGCILTLEEHSLYGGLGGAVAEVVAQTEMVPLDICGIPDEDVPNGSDQEVFKYYKMDVQGIKDRVKALISKKGK